MSNIRVSDYSQLDEEKHTSKQWYAMIEDLRKCVVNVPKWVYYHFLESVPPIYASNGIGFFNSEPLTFNDNGEAVYYYFFKYKSKYYGSVTTIKTQQFLYKLAKESLKEVDVCN